MDSDAPGLTFSAALLAARRSARELICEEGCWLVYEIPAPAYDRRRSPCLVFETEGAFHRMRDYPAEWRELDDAALLALRDGG
jgi:hypothetical protein